MKFLLWHSGKGVVNLDHVRQLGISTGNTATGALLVIRSWDDTDGAEGTQLAYRMVAIDGGEIDLYTRAALSVIKHICNAWGNSVQKPFNVQEAWDTAIESRRKAEEGGEHDA